MTSKNRRWLSAVLIMLQTTPALNTFSTPGPILPTVTPFSPTKCCTDEEFAKAKGPVCAWPSGTQYIGETFQTKLAYNIPLRNLIPQLWKTYASKCHACRDQATVACDGMCPCKEYINDCLKWCNPEKSWGGQCENWPGCSDGNYAKDWHDWLHCSIHGRPYSDWCQALCREIKVFTDTPEVQEPLLCEKNLYTNAHPKCPCQLNRQHRVGEGKWHGIWNPEWIARPIRCDPEIEKIPVCGIDGKEHHNRCWANADRTQALCDGPCPCKGNFPCYCERKVDKVCAKNMRTYDNACLAHCDQQEVDYKGTCVQPHG